jgi:hypothetical protein
VSKKTIITELESMFAGTSELGGVRLHWEGDDSEPMHFSTLQDALEEVAVSAIETGRTAREIERLAYIVSEKEYQAECEEKLSMQDQ